MAVDSDPSRLVQTVTCRASASNRSRLLAAVLGAAANYPYGAEFTSCPVSGTEANWVDGQGIPSVDVELTTTQSSEFVRNLNGVMAVQCWLLGRTDCL
jgi:hypothetical protein